MEDFYGGVDYELDQHEVDSIVWEGEPQLTMEKWIQLMRFELIERNIFNDRVRESMDFTIAESFTPKLPLTSNCNCVADKNSGLKCIADTCVKRKAMVECPHTCDKGCCNSPFLKNSLKTRFGLHATWDRGLALFTDEPILKGEYVLEYIGDVSHYVETSVEDPSYSCHLWSSEKIPLSHRLVIKAHLRGGIARYVRHSHDPNTEFRPLLGSDGELHNMLVAIKPIGPGTEITRNYEDDIHSVDILECLCFSMNIPCSDLICAAKRLEDYNKQRMVIHRTDVNECRIHRGEISAPPRSRSLQTSPGRRVDHSSTSPSTPKSREQSPETRIWIYSPPPPPTPHPPVPCPVTNTTEQCPSQRVCHEEQQTEPHQPCLRTSSPPACPRTISGRQQDEKSPDSSPKTKRVQTKSQRKSSSPERPQTSPKSKNSTTKTRAATQSPRQLPTPSQRPQSPHHADDGQRPGTSCKVFPRLFHAVQRDLRSEKRGKIITRSSQQQGNTDPSGSKRKRSDENNKKKDNDDGACSQPRKALRSECGERRPRSPCPEETVTPRSTRREGRPVTPASARPANPCAPKKPPPVARVTRSKADLNKKCALEIANDDDQSGRGPQPNENPSIQETRRPSLIAVRSRGRPRIYHHPVPDPYKPKGTKGRQKTNPEDMFCIICPKQFTHKGHYNDHMKQVHRQGDPIRCPYPRCRKQCTTKKLLDSHMKTHMAKEDCARYQCPSCLKVLSRRNIVKDHQRRSKGKCADEEPIRVDPGERHQDRQLGEVEEFDESESSESDDEQ